MFIKEWVEWATLKEAKEEQEEQVIEKGEWGIVQKSKTKLSHKNPFPLEPIQEEHPEVIVPAVAAAAEQADTPKPKIFESKKISALQARLSFFRLCPCVSDSAAAAEPQKT